MAQKGKASSKTTVRRIKATDDAPKKEKAVAKKINKPTKITTKAPKKSDEKGSLANPLSNLGNDSGGAYLHLYVCRSDFIT